MLKCPVLSVVLPATKLLSAVSTLSVAPIKGCRPSATVPVTENFCAVAVRPIAVSATVTHT
jgi:hypothetical protein